MKALFLGAHFDDIELGCGGTIHKMHEQWEIHCAVPGDPNMGLNIAHWSNSDRDGTRLPVIANKSLFSLGARTLNHGDFRYGYFHWDRQHLWEWLHRTEEELAPDLVFTMCLDSHQDHETLCRETLRNFRTASVLLYLPSSRNDNNFQPDTFTRLSEVNVDAKMKALDLYGPVFGDRPYFAPEAIKGEMAVHGLRAGCLYAEGFETFRNYLGSKE